ncbi:MAG: transcriptional regulator [Caldilinea sp. CFX5]|nr:transcriptional regulator [Caldilinea sp. CFX5]
MVEFTSDPLTITFHALANPIRREIVALLTRVEKTTVLEIAAHFEISLNGISKHLKVLEGAGIMKREISGRTHYCSLQTAPLDEAEAWIAHSRQFWQERLDGLERFLEQQKQQGQPQDEEPS